MKNLKDIQNIFLGAFKEYGPTFWGVLEDGQGIDEKADFYFASSQETIFIKAKDGYGSVGYHLGSEGQTVILDPTIEVLSDPLTSKQHLLEYHQKEALSVANFFKEPA